MLGIDLKGKRALVTGGSRGVGAATVRILAQAGADVAFTYYSRRPDADALVDEVRALGVRAFAAAGEIADASFVDGVFERAQRELGGLDIFVGNAGIWPPEDVPIVEMTDAQWRRTIAVNLDSIFYSTRAAARLLAAGGRIVLVSSTAGQRGEAGHGDYAASKGAIISLVKGVAVELGARDITVNAVAPGWIDTEMAEPAFAGGARERISAGIPIGRVASAEDIAGPILFLCSPLARHVTGEILNVNGGSVLCG